MPTQGTVAQSLIDPWAVQQRVSTLDARYALNSMLMPIPNQSYIDYRSGVMASGDTAGVGGSSHMAMRVQPGTGLSVTVEMGNAVINTSNQGAYMCCLDSKKTLSLASSSSSSSRIDLIAARVYDDLNSAIGSTSGTRKFTVEVLTGDNSSGTPVAPSITGQGWIPLAHVRVNANASTVTTAMITDKRGPGLVARGGIRGLYGQDALDATTAGHAASAFKGAYPGDQRWVHTNGFQHQIYYGEGTDAKRSGWRGVHNAMVFNASPPAAPNSVYDWHKTLGAIHGITSVTIPYPGTPFMIYPTGRARVWLGPGTAMDLRITVNSTTGPAVNWESEHTRGVPTTSGDTTLAVGVSPIMYGPFDSSITVHLSGYLRQHISGLYGWKVAEGDGREHLLSVVVYPSTVQPPNNAVGNDGSGDDLLGFSGPGTGGGGGS